MIRNILEISSFFFYHENNWEILKLFRHLENKITSCLKIFASMWLHFFKTVANFISTLIKIAAPDQLLEL